LTIYRNY